MERTECGVCTSTDLEQVLNLGDSPLADEFPTTAAAALTMKRYPLGLARCGACSLVQLTEIVPDAELWEGEYGFYTSASWVAAHYQRQYADWAYGQFQRLADQLTVEIACNDGVLLRQLKEVHGARVLGIDPAAGPSQLARDTGLDVRTRPFGTAAAGEVLSEFGPAGLIIANNVVAHVADLGDFLGGIALLLARQGRAVIEFQYVADLITGNQIDHVYHEHRQFFSVASISVALARHGLQVVDILETVPQGGSMRVTVAHQGVVWPTHAVARQIRYEHWLSVPGALAGLQGRADRIRDRLRDQLYALKFSGAKVAGFGASAKSTTLLNFAGITPDMVQYFVDTTPTKHGRYTPGTGIPIISPTADSRAPDVYLLTVWNYAGDIMRRESEYTRRGGKWLVPIPIPVLL